MSNTKTVDFEFEYWKKEELEILCDILTENPSNGK